MLLSTDLVIPSLLDTATPFLHPALHLKDLHSVLHANKRVITVKGRPLINFQRYTLFMHKLKEVLPYSPPDLELYRQRGELAYLEEKLQGVQLGEAAEIQNHSRSQTLRDLEGDPHSRRIARLAKIGWNLGSAGSANEQNSRQEQNTDKMPVPSNGSVQQTETRSDASKAVRAMQIGLAIPRSVKATVRNWAKKGKTSEGL